MGLSVSLSGVAKGLINSFGDDVILRTKVIEDIYDRVTGKNKETITEVNVKGVYQDTAGETQDGKMTIHSGTPIDLHTTIIHNGMERRIIDIVNVQAQNKIMIYEVIVTTDNRALS